MQNAANQPSESQLMWLLLILMTTLVLFAWRCDQAGVLASFGHSAATATGTDQAGNCGKHARRAKRHLARRQSRNWQLGSARHRAPRARLVRPALVVAGRVSAFNTRSGDVAARDVWGIHARV